MSILERVFIPTDNSEPEDLTEDLGLTKEFVRFANLQLSTHHLSFGQILRDLFKEQTHLHSFSQTSRSNQTQLLLALTFLSTLKTQFFPEKLRLCDLEYCSIIFGSAARILGGPELEIADEQPSSDRLKEALSQQSNLIDYKKLMEKQNMDEYKSEIQRLSEEIRRIPKVLPQLQTEATQPDVVFAEQDQIEGFNISRMDNNSNHSSLDNSQGNANSIGRGYKVSVTVNVVFAVVLCGIAVAKFWWY